MLIANDMNKIGDSLEVSIANLKVKVLTNENVKKELCKTQHMKKRAVNSLFTNEQVLVDEKCFDVPELCLVWGHCTKFYFVPFLKFYLLS